MVFWVGRLVEHGSIRKIRLGPDVYLTKSRQAQKVSMIWYVIGALTLDRRLMEMTKEQRNQLARSV